MTVSLPPGYANWINEYRATGDNEAMVNTLGLDLGGATLSGQDLLASLTSLWQAQVVAGMANFMTYSASSLVVGQDGGDPITYDSAPGSGGTVSGTFLPQNCAALIRKQTALGGRRNRGRMFLPYCLAEADVDNIGNLTSTRINALNTQFDSVMSGLDGLGVTPVVLHTLEPIGVTPLPTPITSMTADPRLATQRRRLRR